MLRALRGSASLLVLSTLLLPAFAKPSVPASPAAPTLLPSDFAGWSLTAPLVNSKAADAADAADAAVLKEYGFQEFVTAHYANGDNQLNVRAIRFQDASGAYGAFTFYRKPGSIAEQIGRTAAWDGSHILFWNGATLVDGTFTKVTPMSAAELRELAQKLPQPPGSAGVAPPLPGYLPRQDLDLGFTRYSLGPEAYARTGGVLPAALVDFPLSAEAVTANYSVREGDGQLTLLMYPTPQMAAARMKEIDDFLKAGNAGSTWPQALAESRPGSVLTRRSGPILAVVSGGLPEATAQKLLNQVNYQADVVWNNPKGYISDGSKVARFNSGDLCPDRHPGWRRAAAGSLFWVEAVPWCGCFAASLPRHSRKKPSLFGSIWKSRRTRRGGLPFRQLIGPAANWPNSGAANLISAPPAAVWRRSGFPTN